MCSNSDSIGCIIPGVNVAAAQFCFALQYPHKCSLPANVHDDTFSEMTECVMEEMNSYTIRRGISQQQLTHEATTACLDPKKSWWPRLAAESGDAPVGTQPRSRLLGRRHSECVAKGPSIWLVIMIKDQSRLLPYWLTWHFLLGVSHILVYDHGSQRADAVEAVCRPWIERGVVTVIQWRRQGKAPQEASYNNAIRRTVAAGAEFVGALDADELFVPFHDGCLPRLMSNCTVAAGCGGMQINRRHIRGSKVLSGNPAHPQSALQITTHQMGSVEGTVKSIVRARAAIEYWTPHAVLQRKPFCIMDELMDTCRSTPGVEGRQHKLILRWPPRTARAALYHLQCVTLLDWVMKQSLQGWPSNHESGLYQTLPAIVQGYQKKCAPLGGAANASLRGMNGFHQQAQRYDSYDPDLVEFLRDMDARTLITLAAADRGTEPTS